MEAADYFREQAQESRRIAADLAPSREKEGLLMLATHYEREAKRAAAKDPVLRVRAT
jgi:hypothetical protein